MPKFDSSISLKDGRYIIRINDEDFTSFPSSSFSKETAEEVYTAILAAYTQGKDDAK